MTSNLSPVTITSQSDLHVIEIDGILLMFRHAIVVNDNILLTMEISDMTTITIRPNSIYHSVILSELSKLSLV